MIDKISILLADDHAILRDGLKSALSVDESLNIIGEAENGIETIELCKKFEPDIILMDINMPEMDGIRASKKIKRECNQVKIIILTMFDNRQFISDALSAGIDGFIFKMAHIEELLKAIKTVYNGDDYFDPAVLKIIKQNYLDTNSSKNSSNDLQLTPRENEIIAYIAKGLTVAEIADTLSISYSTVKNHRHSILTKLNLKNSAELVRYALTEGLVK